MEISVAIIEDEKELREMLAILINGSIGYQCIATYASAEQAIQHLPNHCPDVVLVDINLPKLSGIQCVATLKQVCPTSQFMMCTSIEDNDSIFNALKAGASGYITKTTPPAKLLEAITELAQGGSPMSSSIARKVIGSFQQSEEITTKHWQELTKREQEILQHLTKGLRYKEIAEKLFVSPETVRTHIHNIYEKLQVNSRTEAINKLYPRN